MGPSDDRIQREVAAHTKFLFDLSLQATLLQDKAQIRWLTDGDRNTSFLHTMIKVRHLNKTISSLTVGDYVLQDQEAITTHFVQHFERAFTRSNDILDTGLVERVIPSLVTAEENSSLKLIPTPLEVFDEVKHMDGFSAPGLMALVVVSSPIVGML